MVIDVIGDGELDLLVSVVCNDIIGRDVGSVYLFLGVVGGFFEDVLLCWWDGVWGDYFGLGMVLCDFDGDGILDMVVGGVRVENKNVEKLMYD